MNETIKLVVMSIVDLVPNNLIIAMGTMLFVVTCVTVALLEISVVLIVGSIASLIDRILPVAKVTKVSNQAEVSINQQWFRKLMFWQKAG